MDTANNGIVKNSVLNAGAGMALLMTGFLSAVIVARLLGPEASGTIAFSLWLVTTGALIAEMGTGVSLLRILPQLASRGHDLAARRRFAAYLAWPVVASTLVMALGYAAFAALAREAQWDGTASEIAAVTCVLFFVQSIGAFAKNYLIGEQRLGAFFKLAAVSAVLQLACVFLGTWFLGVAGALAGYVAGQIVLFSLTLSLLRARPDNCGLSMRQVAGSSAIVVLEFVVTAIFLTRPEIVFLQFFRDAETVGYYAVALSLANLALQLPIQLTGSLLPYYADHVEKNDGGLPGGIFETVLRNFAYLTLPMSFGLAAVAEPLVSAIYGAAFSEAGIMVAILAAGAPANVFLQLCTQYIFSIDRPGIRLRTAVIGAVAMVVGLLVAVPLYGGAGAATVRNIVLVGMGAYLVRFIKLPGFSMTIVMDLARIVLAALLAAGAAYIVTANVAGLSGVVLAIAAGAIVYLPSLRAVKAVNPSDKAWLADIGRKIPARLRPLYHRLVDFAAPR